MRKRREGVASSPNTQPSSGYDETTSIDELLQATLVKMMQFQTLPAIVFALASDDIHAKEAAAIKLRKMLSIVKNPPIDAVVQSGAVPHLVDILRTNDIPQLQFEAACALAKIVSGISQHTKVVIDCGALPIFVELLASGNDNIREQAVLALGNIAGDSPAYRDLAIGHGALNPVLAQFNTSASISMIRNAAWTLSNLCGDQPQPHFDQVINALPALQWLLGIQDDDVLANACLCLSDISDDPNFKVQAVIDAGICPKLVELLSYSSPFVVMPALHTVGNIVAGDDVQTQVVIDNQALPRILNLLTVEQTEKAIVGKACWTISNITAGTKEQLQAVIDAKIFPPLLLLMSNAELSIKKHAARAVSNATSVGSYEQIKCLAIQGCIKPLCDMLACSDPIIIKVCLEGLQNILKVGEADKNACLTHANVYVREIKDADGLNKIQDLESHENKEISENAIKIVVDYFAEDDDDKIVVNYFTEEDDD